MEQSLKRQMPAFHPQYYLRETSYDFETLTFDLQPKRNMQQKLSRWSHLYKDWSESIHICAGGCDRADKILGKTETLTERTVIPIPKDFGYWGLE